MPRLDEPGDSPLADDDQFAAADGLGQAANDGDHAAAAAISENLP